MPLDTPRLSPRRHVAAQLVRLARCVVCRYYRQLHDLFLKQWDSERSLEYGLERRMGIDNRFLAIASTQIGMHHVTLYGSGTDNGNLDHQIVVVAWFQARQHGHLRPGFNLEYTNGVRLLDHVVHRRIFRRDVGQRNGLFCITTYIGKRFANGA